MHPKFDGASLLHTMIQNRPFYRRLSFWQRFALLIVILPIILLSVITALLYSQQDRIVSEVIQTLNEDFTGRVELDESHISLFAAFPYISIDFQGLRVYENKSEEAVAIADFGDVYVGFDLWTIIRGTMEIKMIRLKDGRLDIVQYPDGDLNILRAFEPQKEIEDIGEEFHLHLKEIRLDHIDVSKLNVENNLMIDAYFTKAISRFRSDEDNIIVGLDASINLSLITNGDTTFINHKTLEVNTTLDYLTPAQTLVISPTTMKLEGASFNAEGSIDFANNFDLNLKFGGSKPNFDLFIAMAPDDLIPVLRRYENAGRVYFETTIQGPSVNGHQPFVNAQFGCENAYLNNFQVNKKLDQLNFSGYFTNGAERTPSTMEFGLRDFSARPEAGTFSGNLVVKNFESPEIDLQLNSDFELEFLAKFFEIKNLEDFGGHVLLTMNFRDIIDLTHPERSIEKLNESYFTQLKIDNLNFQLSTYNLPVKDIDLYAEVNGHEARIEYFRMKAGESDLSISGTISDLPAVLHHTTIPVTTRLNIESKILNLFELTGSDSLTSINERIENLSLGLAFKSSAKALTESPNLPIGEFFIDNLYAKMSHYPHTLHDFHADVFVEEEDFRIIDFRGFIDKSDFHFNGRLTHYDLWFSEHPQGDTRMEFDLDSKLLQLEDLFSYGGENFVPEDYRHEEFRNLKIHGYTDLHFQDGFQSADLRLDRFDAKMNIHPMKLERFNGRLHYEKDHLQVDEFSGRIGKSDFKTTLHYYLGKDETQIKRENKFTLVSSRLDFDELFAYTPPQSDQQADHDSVFNIYELPFTHMSFDFRIDHLNYHKYLIHQFRAKLRTTPNHYLYVDEGHLEAAGGTFELTGYFNGSDPKHIYFNPDMTITRVDLDKLMLKFDNFGQDHLVSENLHGIASGKLKGKILVHPDLVPKIDESDIQIDFEVLNGRLENFALFEYMSDFFKDKNLKSVRFDTLSNTLSLKKGVMTIPQMTINSSIGFLDISGSQDFDMNMDYFLRIPWRMVTDAASSKLFGRKREEVDPDQVDDIQYADPAKRVRYVNIRFRGTPDDYKITLEKPKEKSKVNRTG